MYSPTQLLFFGVPLSFSAVLLAALHWYPWRDLSRVAAYAVGTCVTVGVPVLTMLAAALVGTSYDELVWAAFLVANTVVCGATVQLAYLVDSRRPLTLEDKHAATRD
jgi:hypothetical protein